MTYKAMGGITTLPNDRQYITQMTSVGTKFDEPPTFQRFVNTSIVPKPLKPPPRPPQRYHPNQISWSEVLANAHIELNKLGGNFSEYTAFSLEQQEHWCDDLVEASILRKWTKQ